MPRIQLPPSCGGFADGNTKYMAERGPGSFVNIDDTDPAGQRALQKLEVPGLRQRRACRCRPGEVLRQEGPEGRWCRGCGTLWHSWTKICGRCDLETIPEGEMDRDLPAGQYVP